MNEMYREQYTSPEVPEEENDDDEDTHHITPEMEKELERLSSKERTPPVITLPELYDYAYDTRFAKQEDAEYVTELVNSLRKYVIEYAETIAQYNLAILNSKEDSDSDADALTISNIRRSSHTAFIISVNALIRYLNMNGIKDPWMNAFTPDLDASDTPAKPYYTQFAMALFIDEARRERKNKDK